MRCGVERQNVILKELCHQPFHSTVRFSCYIKYGESSSWKGRHSPLNCIEPTRHQGTWWVFCLYIDGVMEMGVDTHVANFKILQQRQKLFWSVSIKITTIKFQYVPLNMMKWFFLLIMIPSSKQFNLLCDLQQKKHPFWKTVPATANSSIDRDEPPSCISSHAWYLNTPPRRRNVRLFYRTRFILTEIIQYFVGHGDMHLFYKIDIFANMEVLFL